MRGPIVVRRFQGNNHVTVAGQRQSLLRDRRPRHIPTKTLKLLPLIGLTGHTCMQRKASLLADQFARFRAVVAGRHSLQCHRFLPRIRPKSRSVSHRSTYDAVHGIVFLRYQIQILRLGIPVQIPCPLKMPGNTFGNLVRDVIQVFLSIYSLAENKNLCPLAQLYDKKSDTEKLIGLKRQFGEFTCSD